LRKHYLSFLICFYAIDLFLKGQAGKIKRGKRRIDIAELKDFAKIYKKTTGFFIG